MIYGSVCSGIEAATVAWHGLGWTPAWFSEIEPFPKRVLAHHYPTVPNLGDFTKIGAESGPVDLLVGGTPCQSFSVAGLRKGLDDPRGNLMLEFGALARRVRARWVVWENVPGVLSSNGGRDFGAFLGMLGELGYGFAYRVLDAQFFGVAQRRRRVFVVGHARGLWQRAAAVLFEPESLRGDPAPRREAGEGIADGLEASLGRRCGGPSCGSRDGQLVAHALTGNGFDASEDGTGRGTPLVVGPERERALVAHPSRSDLETETFVVQAQGVDFQNVETTGDTCGTLMCAQAGHGALIPFDPLQVTSKANRSTCTPGALMHTLPASPASPAVAFPWQAGSTQDWNPSIEVAPPQVNGQVHAVHAVHAVRRLTPRECERLQGFPDDYTAIPGTGPKKQKLEEDYLRYLLRPVNGRRRTREECFGLAADGPRYRALGNSMAVPVMSWIGRRLDAVDRACRAADTEAA